MPTDFNAGLNMAGSYYAATASPFARAPAAAGEVEADLVVVGGGCTGLSAALHAAKAGLSVVLLEGGRIGWGASGRNGGQIIPGPAQGRGGARRAVSGESGPGRCSTWRMEARDLVVALIAEHAIDCDLKTTGHLLARGEGRGHAPYRGRSRVPGQGDGLSATPICWTPARRGRRSTRPTTAACSIGAAGTCTR